jgi:enoyl-CoA hydratase/carnithine racemase
MPERALIRLERRGPTALLSLSRPPVNALNLPLVEELASVVRALDADPPSGSRSSTGR